MKKMLGILVITCFSLFGLVAPAQAQQAALPIPSVRTMIDIPGAKELPDPTLNYQIVFDLTAEPGHEDESNPNLELIDGLVNTFAKYGVDRSHRHFVVVLHGGTIMLATNDESYKKLNKGKSNPSREMLNRLEAAGVQMVACGQSALSKGISPEMIDSKVQLNLSATITFMNLGTRGYVRVQV